MKNKKLKNNCYLNEIQMHGLPAYAQIEINRLCCVIGIHKNDIQELVTKNQRIYDYLYELGIKWPNSIIEGIEKLVTKKLENTDLKKNNKQLERLVEKLKTQLRSITIINQRSRII